jgi:hypothetical protein
MKRVPEVLMHGQGETRRLCGEVALLDEVRRALGGGAVVLPSGLEVPVHLEQVSADRVEAVVAAQLLVDSSEKFKAR